MEPRQTQVGNPSRRSWLRFSLSFLLLLVTVACVWLAYVSNRARSQKRAVDRVIELGGHVGFDYQFDANMDWRKDPQLPAPVWLIDLIGEDYARSVVIVNFDEGSDPTDDDLAVLRRFTELKQLTLMDRKRITDDGLRHLARLSKLEVLALKGTNVRGEGLQHIRNLQNLEGLTLDNTPLTDEGLEYIVHFPKLEWLFISNTQVTDDGLRHVASLPSLQDLQMRGTAITDVGLKHLAPMTTLKRVLVGDKVSPEGRAWLKRQLPE